MMRRGYPEYKPSGVDWLGDIPRHWEFKNLKRVSAFSTGWTPPTGKDEYYDGDNLWANISDLGPRYLFDTSKRISDDAIAVSRLRLTPKGSLLFSFKLSVGQVSITGAEMYTNEAIASFLPAEQVNVDFLYWATPLFVPKNAIENIYGAKLLNQDLIKNAGILVPAPDDQRAIVAFLDRETARIDGLIAKKERQIELLQEKRAALISHAVTKGLDPKAPMKPSGIEWLGDVPAHWEVHRAKVLFREVKDRSETGEEELLTVSHLTGVTRRSEKDVNMFMAESLEGYKVCAAGDLVINTMWAWMGAMGMAPEAGIVSPSYNVYRSTRPDFEPRYYDMLFRTGAFVKKVTCESQGVWTSRLRLYPEYFYGIGIPIPPPEEQREIVKAVDRETGHYDRFRARIERSIEMLQEYRTALISAAVTGKIDVRKGSR